MACIGCDQDAPHGINYYERRTSGPMTTSALRTAWAPACPTGELVTLSLHGDGRITIRKGTEHAWQLLNAVLVRHDYRTRRADTGAYNCRQITGGTGFSLHAYGIAADLNWSTNLYGPNLITDMPPAMIADIRALYTSSGAQLFRWGGDYSTNKDAMHFELVCTPADVASGVIDPYKPPAPPEPEPPKGPLMALTDAQQDELYAWTKRIHRELTSSADSTSPAGASLLWRVRRIGEKVGAFAKGV